MASLFPCVDTFIDEFGHMLRTPESQESAPALNVAPSPSDWSPKQAPPGVEGVTLSALELRFLAKTKRADAPRPGMTTPCLEWTAGWQRGGYGAFWFGGKMGKAHRVAWEMKHGPIPNGLHVLHKCDNPPCVDEEHLFLGTHADNMHDMFRKERRVAARGDSSGPRLYPERMARVGEKNGNARLGDADIPRIFQLRALGWTLQRIGSEFGISLQSIHRILNRRQWAHVQPEAPNGVFI